MSDYKEGFQDGYNHAREEIIEKLREIDINDIDAWVLDKLSDMIEENKLCQICHGQQPAVHVALVPVSYACYSFPSPLYLISA